MPGLAKALSIVFAVVSCLLLIATPLSLFVFNLDVMATLMFAIFTVATAFSALTYRAEAGR
jgi:glucose dehydrogenase